jgi:murein L,D-transpeptidase YafK
MKTFIFALCLLLSIQPVLAIEKADRVVAEKSKQLLLLYKQNKLIASYRASFGRKMGAKQQLGDSKTPEGHYILDAKTQQTQFYKAIHISYPNAQDKENARKLGVNPGGDIMIHGQKNGYAYLAPKLQLFNWTQGCIALSNEDMDKVWDAIDPGTPIDIKF